MGAVSLRQQARWLDNNHDLVIGVFDKLEERVVGAKGIIVEPHPMLTNGKIAKNWPQYPQKVGRMVRQTRCYNPVYPPDA
jgi:capsid protein